MINNDDNISCICQQKSLPFESLKKRTGPIVGNEGDGMGPYAVFVANSLGL